MGNQCEKLEALENSEVVEDLEDIVAYDKVTLKPFYEYNCTFRSHVELLPG